MEKRGQAAAFIIIGLIVLIIVIGVIAVRKGFLQDLFEKISTERRTIPQQIRPVQDFLDSCVSQITKEGIADVALHGGYLSFKEDTIPTTPFTPLGNSLEIIPNTDFRTAVWFRETGNGIQELNAPTKQDVENSIAEYVEDNFVVCVSNLTQFTTEGFTATARDSPKATIQISRDQVSSVVKFPMEVKVLDTNFSLEKHQATVESKLGKLYQMAIEIQNSENKGTFLENKTIDLLVAYDPEIPYSGTDFSCTEKIWLKSDVETKLKDTIFENVAAVRIKGTDYQLQDDKFEYMEFDALSTEDSSVTANLMYNPEWPTVVEITPSEGNVLRSDLITKKAGGPVAVIASALFCLNQHRFVYDIKYPVLISLTDDSGLTFQFATEVIIDNNQPRTNRLEVLDLPDTSSPICQYPQKEVSIYTSTVSPNGRLVPLDNVSLNFKCFPAVCSLGDSKTNENGEPVLTTKVPLCYNGVLEGHKEGYKQIEKTFFSSNEENAPSFITVNLEPMYKKEVKLFVIDKDTGAVREPYSTEQINFQFVASNTNYQTIYTYPSEDNTIQLLPGEYTINSYISRNSSTYKITIPKQTLKTCVDTESVGLLGFFQNKQVCKSTETEPLEFDTILTGGATNVIHPFTRIDLENDAPLNLYVLSSTIPGSLEDLQKVQISLDTNKDHPLFREPKIE